LQLGDLVFFRSRRSPSGWHVGFYLGNNNFLQAPSKGDRVKISSLNEYPYNKSYKGAGRF
jgi:cell wall-associated NlpC family hydrolase